MPHHVQQRTARKPCAGNPHARFERGPCCNPPSGGGKLGSTNGFDPTNAVERAVHSHDPRVVLACAWVFDIVVAADLDWGIGKDKGLPWPKLRGDLRHFKKTASTASAGKRNAIVMGRKTTQEAVRGFGQGPTNLALERTMDEVANALGLDRLEIRRRNMIRHEEFPYTIPSGTTYDSGDYHAVIDKVIAHTSYEDLKKQRDLGLV